MKKSISLKQHIEMFLMKYKNRKTWLTYKQVFKIIEQLNTIDVKKIIDHAKEVFKTFKWRSETKNHRATIVKTFCKRLALATFQNSAIYYIKEWEPYPPDLPLRQVFTDREEKIIAQALIDFDHPKFALAFKLLAHNGLRLGEFVRINWNTLKATNYETQFCAQKRGKIGYFAIPNYLVDDFETHGMTLSYNTIQNLFCQFNKFVRSNYPEFTKPIHAHIMRHVNATKGAENGLSPDELRISYGLTNTAVLNKTYVHSNIVIQKQLYQRKNMTPINSLEIKQKEDLINTQRLIIIKLKEKLKKCKIDAEEVETVQKLFTI